VTPPTTTRAVFEGAWESLIGAALGIYHLRRSFALWIEEMGLPLSRQRLYLGHSARNTTEMYTRRDLTAWLVGDAEKMLTYVAGELGISGASIPDFHPDRLFRTVIVQVG
jgi:integrase